MRFIMLCFILFSLSCLAHEGYKVYDYQSNLDIATVNMPTVFILDYSNSMNERIMGETKYNILKRSFENVLSQIPEEIPVGVRVYGQRWGFTNYDACRASVMAEEINKYNREIIPQKLAHYKPRGMTPITYSLKQTIEKDFPKDNNPKHIVLITDGGENCDESPCDYAIELIKTRKDIKIDVIAINLNNTNDLEQLACTANVTSGKLYEVNSESKLQHDLNEIMSSRKKVDARIIK